MRPLLGLVLVTVAFGFGCRTADHNATSCTTSSQCSSGMVCFNSECVTATAQGCPTSCGDYSCYTTSSGQLACYTNCGGCLGIPGSLNPPYQNQCAPGKQCNAPSCKPNDLLWKCR